MSDEELAKYQDLFQNAAFIWINAKAKRLWIQLPFGWMV